MTPKYLAWRKLFSHTPHIMDFVVVSSGVICHTLLAPVFLVNCQVNMED